MYLERIKSQGISGENPTTRGGSLKGQTKSGGGFRELVVNGEVLERL
jgi:hypothetical protein